MTQFTRIAVAIFALMLAVLIAAGCGANGSINVAKDTQVAGREQTVPEEYEERISEFESRTRQERIAACEAMRCAEDSNPGSCFEAMSVRVSGEWARVTVEESGVPAEEAVGFDVFLRQIEDGTWEVAETGNNVTADQLTGAPPDLFEK